MKNIEETKAEPTTNKFLIFIIIAIVIASACMILSAIFANEKLKFSDDTQIQGSGDVTVVINYPKPNDYIYKEVGTNPKTYEVTNKNGDYIVNITLDNTTIKNEYNGNFNNFREIKTIGVNSEDITINNVTGFGFYNKNQDQYQIFLPCGENQMVKINVQPVIRFSGENAEELYKRDDVKTLIDSINIKNM